MKVSHLALATVVFAFSGIYAVMAQDKAVEGPQPAPIIAPTPKPTATVTPAPDGEAISVPDDTTTVKAPDGCKFVQVHRPDIDPDYAKIYVTFRGYGSTADAIEACNPDSVIRAGGSTVFGVVDSPTAGARVSIKTNDKGIGVVGLPLVLTNGRVHQVACKFPTTGTLYRASWNGDVPDIIDLKKVDGELSQEKLDALCLAAMTPDLRAKLQKKN